MYGAHCCKQVHGGITHLKGVIDVDVTVIHGGLDGIPALRFDLFSRARAPVILGRHLCQQTVPQPERRITKAAELAAFQEFSVNHGAGGNNLGSSPAPARMVSSPVD